MRLRGELDAGVALCRVARRRARRLAEPAGERLSVRRPRRPLRVGATRWPGRQVVDVVRADGQREIIGVSSKLSEAEVHWRDFLLEIKAAGCTA